MNQLSTLIVGMLFLFLFSCTTKHANTTFFLTRHAEKTADDTKDPSLSLEGQQRSARLLELLTYTDVDVVLSSPYQRTRNTVRPVAEAKQLEVIDYDPSVPNIIEKWAKEYAGKTILISGHSNTIPNYVNQLAGTNYEQLEEQEYDKLFIVNFRKPGKGKVIVLKY